MTYNILFFIVGFGIVALAIKAINIDKRIDSLERDHIHHDELFTDVDWHRVDDLRKLSEVEQRVNELEEKVKMLEDEVY